MRTVWAAVNPWSAWWANVTWPWVMLITIGVVFVAAVIAVVLVAVAGASRERR